MYLENDGFINVKGEEATEQFLSILKKWKDFDNAVEEDYRDNGTVSYTFSDVSGDIEDDLNALAKECLEQGIELYGEISYYGDLDGMYVIENGKCGCFDLQTFGVKVALQNNTIISPKLKLELLSLLEQAFIQDKDHSNISIEQAIALLNETHENDYL